MFTGVPAARFSTLPAQMCQARCGTSWQSHAHDRTTENESPVRDALDLSRFTRCNSVPIDPFCSGGADSTSRMILPVDPGCVCLVRETLRACIPGCTKTLMPGNFSRNNSSTCSRPEHLVRDAAMPFPRARRDCWQVLRPLSCRRFVGHADTQTGISSTGGCPSRSAVFRPRC